MCTCYKRETCKACGITLCEDNVHNCHVKAKTAYTVNIALGGITNLRANNRTIVSFDQSPEGRAVYDLFKVGLATSDAGTLYNLDTQEYEVGDVGQLKV